MGNEKYEVVSIRSQASRTHSTTLNAEGSLHAFEQNDLSHNSTGRFKSINRRLGRTTLTSLLVTVVMQIIIVATLLFFWHTQPNNTLWHTVMIKGWITRVISIATFFLRLAIDTQASYVAAMAAALTLEQGAVLMKHAAKVSKARADGSSPRNLLVPILLGWAERRTWTGVLHAASIIILVLTTFGLQFSSTLLLSDLHLGTLPSFSRTSLVPFDFQYRPFFPQVRSMSKKLILV